MTVGLEGRGPPAVANPTVVARLEGSERGSGDAIKRAIKDSWLGGANSKGEESPSSSHKAD